MNELKDRMIQEIRQAFSKSVDREIVTNIIDSLKIKVTVTGKEIQLVIKCDYFTYQYLCCNFAPRIFSEASYNNKTAKFVKYLFE